MAVLRASDDGEFRLYHDDGAGVPPDPQTRFVLNLTWSDADRRLTITPQEGDIYADSWAVVASP